MVYEYSYHCINRMFVMVDKHSTQQITWRDFQFGDRTGSRYAPKTKQRLYVYSVLEKLHGVKLEEAGH
jgi:hypothetical protein